MRRLLVASCLALLGARPASAQTGTIPEGALDFIRSIGARSVGMGQAVVAGAEGTEAVWANPALVARSPREGSLDFRNKASAAEAEADVSATLVWPVLPVGSVAAFVRYLNYGAQDVQTGPTTAVGSFTNTSLIIGASFATTFFDRLAVGVTAKQLRIQFSCTGECSQLGSGSASQPTVSALDFGAQYFVFRDSSLSVGASVVNLGPRLQIVDSPQADPLPARGSVGVVYAPALPSVPDVTLRFAADVVTRISGGDSPGFRIGGEATYLKRFSLRAGYIRKGPGEIDTPTIGFGLTSGRLHVDIAQMMTNFGAESGRPTFLGLHLDF